MANARIHSATESTEISSSALKENSPWPVFALLILGSMALSIMWFIAKGPVRVSRPRLQIDGTHVIVASEVVNRTSEPVHLSLQFVLGDLAGARSRVSRSLFNEIAHRAVEITLEPRSTRLVHCDFEVPDLSPYRDLQALVQVLRRE
jgi:hypothetical protein